MKVLYTRTTKNYQFILSENGIKSQKWTRMTADLSTATKEKKTEIFFHQPLLLINYNQTEDKKRLPRVKNTPFADDGDGEEKICSSQNQKSSHYLHLFSE